MAPTQVHHHRSTTKSANKPYKTKHASKGALKEQAKGMEILKATWRLYSLFGKLTSSQAKLRWSGALAKPPTNS